jgi:hypothetical protein
LDDPFDNDDLATGGPSAVNGGFQEASSSDPVPAAFEPLESGGVATLDSNGSVAANGILSLSMFDASEGVTATWEVASVSMDNDGTNRRSFYSLQGGTTWGLQQGPAVYIEIDPVNSLVELRIRGAGAALASGFDSQSFTGIVRNDPDGFTLTADYTPAGYAITSSGLNTGDGSQVNLVGAWDTTGEHTFATLFQSGDLHVGSYVQDPGSVLVVDRITAVAIPEPATGLLILLGLCSMARCVRGRKGS